MESIYREAYERARSAKDELRMADLDAAFQREQLLLEVLLDIRDAVSTKAGEPARSGPDAITALQTVGKIIKR